MVEAYIELTLTNFGTYMMGKQTIYLSFQIGNTTYDYIPCTSITQPADEIKKTMKFYPLQGVEMRGNSLDCGFRPIANFDIQIWERDDNWWNKK